MENTFSFENENRRLHFEKINEKLSNVSMTEISSTINKIEFYIEHFTIVGKQKSAYRKQVNFLTNIKKVLNFEKNRRALSPNSS